MKSLYNSALGVDYRQSHIIPDDDNFDEDAWDTDEAFKAQKMDFVVPGLMVRRKPYWLWVGCVGQTEHTFPEGGLSVEVANSIPPKSIIWNLSATTEMGLIGRLLRTDDRSNESVRLMELLVSRIKLLNDFDRVA